MKLKKLFTDDDAVSPVIGDILMVAITVILAAVIATFVLELGEQVTQTTPNANFNTEAPDNEFTYQSGNSETLSIAQLTHSSGPAIETDTLEIVEPNLNLDGSTSETNSVSTSVVGLSSTDEISAGDSIDYEITIDYDSTGSGSTEETLIDEGDEVILTWSSEGDSATLRSYELPDAVTVTNLP